MKYKLINNKTKEEHLCEKVTIDGFDYYVSDMAKILTDNLYVISKRTNYLGKTFYPKNDGTVTDDVIKELLLSVKYEGHYETTVGNGSDCDLVIATNNPNIDIAKVVDEVDIIRETLVNTYLKKIIDLTKRFFWKAGFKHGYNKSQETHPNSNEDMVEFYEWCDTSEKAAIFWRRNRVDPDMSGNHYKKIRENRKKLLQLWKEQQHKIIYYE